MSKKNNVYQLSSYRSRDAWKEIFSCDDEYVSVSIYLNKSTFEMELVMVNDAGEALSMGLNNLDSLDLAQCLSEARADFKKIRGGGEG